MAMITPAPRIGAYAGPLRPAGKSRKPKLAKRKPPKQPMAQPTARGLINR